MNYRIKMTAFILLLLPFNAVAQVATGGGFTIEKSVVATGGGASSGGGFSITGTAGQNAAGTNSSGSLFNHQAGFWVADQFVPTAAMVTISGKVKTADGRGIRNARVTLTDSTGVTRTTITGAFGHYRFTDVEVGQTYILSVTSKRFVFANPSRVITVNEELTDLDFIANQP